jgi:hypothetical protein
MPDRVTWDKDIRILFTQADIGCMGARRLDLGDRDSVWERRMQILQRLKVRRESPDSPRGMPQWSSPWDDGQIAKFEEWANQTAPI